MNRELFPIISTTDIPRSLGFYRDLLGAEVTYEFRAPDGTLGYIGLELGTSHFGIGLEPGVGSPAPPRPISLWVYVDDCDAAFEALRAAGSEIVEEPADQPWGERVARVRDPDGNDVIIGSRTERSP